jgi:hypothetical protein
MYPQSFRHVINLLSCLASLDLAIAGVVVVPA